MSTMIAATTAALRDLLRSRIMEMAPDMTDLLVTAEAPDRARGGRSVPQLNLFLFGAPVDPAMRDRDPATARDKDVSAFSVTLSYLLTAYGRESDDSDLTSHRVLGGAMAALQGNRLLENIAPGPLRIDRLEITALDMARLWASFQTPFRLSAAYTVGPVPIESI